MKKQILLVASYYMVKAAIAQPGSIDLTFNPGSGAGQAVNCVALQPDGKIVLAGGHTQYNGNAVKYINRINSNGSFDPTFATTGTGLDGTVNCVIMQPDGKFIVSGSFYYYNGAARKGIARVNSDGSLDSTFIPGIGINGYTYYDGLAIQPDGKIIIGGLFTSYNGTSRKYIARVNSDGSLDLSFNPGTGFDAQLYSVKVQPDGKILACGSFTSYNGTSRNHITRINPDGTLDTSFDPGTGADALVLTIELLPGNQIMIAGSFTYYNGLPTSQIARLNSDGSLDTTFNSGTGTSLSTIPNIWSSDVQLGGPIIIGGEFTDYDGNSRNRIARINGDGSLDLTFDPGTGFPGMPYSVVLQPDGKIICGGSFTSFNGTARNRICRIHGNLPPVADFSVSSYYVCGSDTISVADSSSNFPTSWQWSVNPASGTSIANAAAQNTTIAFSIPGTYTVQLVTTNITGSDSATKTITVYALPVAIATAQGPTLFCTGDNVQINADSAVSYLWNTGETTQNITVSQNGSYYVTITDTDGCSDVSDGVIITVDSAANPGICLVTVDTSSSSQNVIVWEKPGVTDIDSFRVYREIGLNNYVYIGSVSFDSLSLFTDTTNGVNPKIQSYRYKITVVDTCGGESVFSVHHRTIHLATPQFTPPGTYDLIWTNDYEGFSFPYYYILRDGYSTGNWQVIDSVTYGNLSYTDLYAPGDKARYIIEARPPQECNATLKVKKYNASKSNTSSMEVGINEMINRGLSLYPNPNKGKFVVEIQDAGFNRLDAEIKIYNILGKTIYQLPLTNNRFHFYVDITLSQPGIYNVQLSGDGIIFNRKIVVE